MMSLLQLMAASKEMVGSSVPTKNPGNDPHKILDNIAFARYGCRWKTHVKELVLGFHFLV
jgi:hypothetical protein